jgi:hypothetical protein
MDLGFDCFRARDEDWKHIEMASKDPANRYAVVVRELRDRISALEADKQPVKPKPPLGIRPRFLCDELRLRDINDAIDRYKKAEKTIPGEWLTERRELISRIEQAEQTEQAIAAKEQGLLKSVKTAIKDHSGHKYDETIRAAISAVANWLDRNGNQRAAIQIADELHKSAANK